jgi:hypothetical protein
MARKSTQMRNQPNEKPPINVNVYGRNAPKAATAGQGARTLEEINQATDARRAQRPGDYNNTSNKR